MFYTAENNKTFNNVIFCRLLGPSTAQEVIQLTTGQALNQGIRDARFLVMDATADQGISRNGAAGSTGCVSNYTALHWWCEEAKALDGESLHDSVVGKTWIYSNSAFQTTNRKDLIIGI